MLGSNWIKFFLFLSLTLLGVVRSGSLHAANQTHEVGNLLELLFSNSVLYSSKSTSKEPISLLDSVPTEKLEQLDRIQVDWNSSAKNENEDNSQPEIFESNSKAMNEILENGSPITFVQKTAVIIMLILVGLVIYAVFCRESEKLLAKFKTLKLYSERYKNILKADRQKMEKQEEVGILLKEPLWHSAQYRMAENDHESTNHSTLKSRTRRLSVFHTE